MNQGLGNKRLRIGFAGAGAISVFHLAGWKDTLNIEVVAVCDPVQEKARARAQEFGIERTYTDFAQMLERERPDAVDIATPVGTHAELTLLAAQHGVHVMCQKPLTPTVAQARSLITQVGNRIRFMVHENYRFRPHYLQMKRWLDEGRIGTPQHARMTVRSASMVTVDGATPPLLKRQPYLLHFKRLLIFEALIHQLDVLRVMLGPLTVVSTQLAKVNRDLAGEDLAIIVLRGSNGATALIDANICASGYAALPVDRLEIMGSSATMIYDTDRIYLVGRESETIGYDLAKNYQASFTNTIQEFVRGLRTGEPFATEPGENLETLQLMESSYVVAGIEIE